MLSYNVYIEWETQLCYVWQSIISSMFSNQNEINNKHNQPEKIFLSLNELYSVPGCLRMEGGGGLTVNFASFFCANYNISFNQVKKFKQN